ncbi:MAG: glycosyltransferase [Lachnospiraceae bacterium]|nr:glycosyltransferase [Lachnospiraceae bacterium]
MSAWNILFALSVAAPFYTYGFYPMILKILPKRNYQKDADYEPTVSLLIAAYNEEKVIEEKIWNLLQLDYPSNKIEILVASDGSTDNTVLKAERVGKGLIQVLDLPRGGKVAALNAMLSRANGEIIVFSDANTMFEKSAVQKIVQSFKDQRIGCVSGQLRYKVDKTSGEGARSESAYWKYENWVKRQESRLGRLSGANGAIYAIRREYLNDIPAGIINDDFYVSTYILQQGYDVILNTEAIAYEEPNERLEEQFKRHVRDGAGHYQAMRVFWRMLFPRKGSFVYVSHRVIKWLVPFFMITAFISNLILGLKNLGWFFLWIFQVAGYIAMLIYWTTAKRHVKIKGFIGKLLSIVFYFISVNAALLCGFFKFVGNKQKAVWETSR